MDLRRSFTGLLLMVAVALLYSANARAVYFIDGSVGTDPLSYDNPNDGQCVVGMRMNAGNAEFLVDKNITNYRDCAAYTTNLTGMTTQATCAPAAAGTTLGAGTSGWRHSWATGVCVSGANGVSRLDLDNTAAMCTSKGGTIGNACVAYGWLYRGIDPVTGAAPPITGSPAAAPFNTSNYAVWHGVDSTTGNGFCYATMDFTTAPSGGYTRPLSTSWPDPGNPNACPMFDPNNATGRSRTGTTWSDYVWNWKTEYKSVCTGSGQPLACCTGVGTGTNCEKGIVPPANGTICRNAYGVRGKLLAAISASVAGNAYNTTTKYDLTGITNQAACVANGFSWEPTVRTTGFVDATVRGVMSATPCGTATDCYAGVDITTPGNAGGGKFVSRQCLKCHSDQSRGFIELNKPGFIETPHKQAGDSSDPVIAGIGNNVPWQLKGIQCSICHAASNPQQTDVINKNNAGNFIITSAHENATAGAGVTQVCYHCHSDATLGSSANTTPAAVIPVSGGDFAANGQHLAPIVNEFLNSPHGQYRGSNDGGQLRNHANYASTFIGYNCKTAGSVPATASAVDDPGGTVPWDATNCPAAGHVWAKAPATSTASYACYFTSTSCAAAGGTWQSTYDKLNYPYGGTGNELCTASLIPWSCCTGAGTGTCVNIGDNAACTASGAPMSCCTGAGTGTCSTGVCSGIGLGSSLTTVHQSGAVEKIEFPDSTTNTNCTNPGDGSATSGAVGYWVPEGKDAYTSQGSCMTCHDVHWDFDSTIPGAEPFRRECTTCHVNSGTSASGAPQIDLATINHLKTPGTPLENWTTDPNESCEKCHMATESGTNSLMHIWRINTDPNYQTMGATQANTAAEKKCAGGVNAGKACAINVDCPSSTCGTVYANAVWVDIPHACGQCHGTDGITAMDPGAPPRSTAQLAVVAKGMHDAAGANCQVTFSIAKNGLTVNVTAFVDCSPNANTGLTYEWDWGDSTSHGTVNPGSHTYAAGAYSIKVTVKKNGLVVGSMTRSVTLIAPDLPPTAAISGGACTWTANTWTMSLADASTDTDSSPVQTVYVDWGDGSTRSFGGQGSAFSHTYTTAGSFAVALTAIDSALKVGTPVSCPTPATPTYFTISGTVKNSTGANVPSAAVTVKKAGVAVKTVYTLANGTFSAGSLKPGTYTLVVTKAGYTFAVPAAGPITVGGSSAGNTINALTP